MKIDVGRILIAHVMTMKDSGRSKLSKADLILFYGAPLAVAGLCVWFRWRFNADVLNALLTAYSIFAGLLLNLLLLVYTFSTQTVHPSALAAARSSLVRELHDNIAYSILISIVLVVLCMAATAYLKMYEPPRSTNPLLTGSIIFLTLNFVLTLLMILKRIYTLMSVELSKRPKVADFTPRSHRAQG